MLLDSTIALADAKVSAVTKEQLKYLCDNPDRIAKTCQALALMIIAHDIDVISSKYVENSVTVTTKDLEEKLSKTTNFGNAWISRVIADLKSKIANADSQARQPIIPVDKTLYGEIQGPLLADPEVSIEFGYQSSKLEEALSHVKGLEGIRAAVGVLGLVGKNVSGLSSGLDILQFFTSDNANPATEFQLTKYLLQLWNQRQLDNDDFAKVTETLNKRSGFFPDELKDLLNINSAKTQQVVTDDANSKFITATTLAVNDLQKNLRESLFDVDTRLEYLEKNVSVLMSGDSENKEAIMNMRDELNNLKTQYKFSAAELAKINALLAKTDLTLKEIKDLINNMRSKNFLAMTEKQKALQREYKIMVAENSIRIATMAIALITKDERVAKAFNTAANTGLSIYKIVTTVGAFATHTAMLSNAVGIAFTAFSGLQSIINLFQGAAGKDKTEENALEAIKKYLETISADQKKVIKTLDEILKKMEAGQYNIMRELQAFKNEFSKYVDQQDENERTKARNKFLLKLGEYNAIEDPSDSDNYKDIRNLLNYIVAYANYVASTHAFSGATSIALTAEETSEKIKQTKQLRYFFGLLPKIIMLLTPELSSQLPMNISLPNPYEWINACKCFIAILNNSNIVMDSFINNLLSQLIQKGELILSALKLITSDEYRKSLKDTTNAQVKAADEFIKSSNLLAEINDFLNGSITNNEFMPDKYWEIFSQKTLTNRWKQVDIKQPFTVDDIKKIFKDRERVRRVLEDEARQLAAGKKIQDFKREKTDQDLIDEILSNNPDLKNNIDKDAFYFIEKRTFTNKETVSSFEVGQCDVLALAKQSGAIQLDIKGDVVHIAHPSSGIKFQFKLFQVKGVDVLKNGKIEKEVDVYDFRQWREQVKLTDEQLAQLFSRCTDAKGASYDAKTIRGSVLNQISFYDFLTIVSRQHVYEKQKLLVENLKEKVLADLKTSPQYEQLRKYLLRLESPLQGLYLSARLQDWCQSKIQGDGYQYPYDIYEMLVILIMKKLNINNLVEHKTKLNSYKYWNSDGKQNITLLTCDHSNKNALTCSVETTGSLVEEAIESTLTDIDAMFKSFGDNGFYVPLIKDVLDNLRLTRYMKKMDSLANPQLSMMPILMTRTLHFSSATPTSLQTTVTSDLPFQYLSKADQARLQQFMLNMIDVINQKMIVINRQNEKITIDFLDKSVDQKTVDQLYSELTSALSGRCKINKNSKTITLEASNEMSAQVLEKILLEIGFMPNLNLTTAAPVYKM